MESKRHEPRLISIEVRAQQFGYAVFEGSEGLLDYGGGQLRPGGRPGAVIAAKRIGNLIQIFAPSALALKHPERTVTRRHPGIRSIVSAIRREASLRLVPHRIIRKAEIRMAFGATNKYAVAAALAEFFPELHRRLPSPRSLGDPEHPRMVVFDAISVGFTYWHQIGNTGRPSK
jgi:hypothetical protein